MRALQGAGLSRDGAKPAPETGQGWRAAPLGLRHMPRGNDRGRATSCPGWMGEPGCCCPRLQGMGGCTPAPWSPKPAVGAYGPTTPGTGGRGTGQVVEVQSDFG